MLVEFCKVNEREEAFHPFVPAVLKRTVPSNSLWQRVEKDNKHTGVTLSLPPRFSSLALITCAKEGFVFHGVCVCVCFSKITQRVIDGFLGNFVERWAMGQQTL